MTEHQWATLSSIERQLLICALEGTSGLAFVDGVDEDGKPVDLPGEALSLVHRGWVTVHRMEPWTAPDGRKDIAYGPTSPGKRSRRFPPRPDVGSRLHSPPPGWSRTG